MQSRRCNVFQSMVDRQFVGGMVTVMGTPGTTTRLEVIIVLDRFSITRERMQSVLFIIYKLFPQVESIAF